MHISKLRAGTGRSLQARGIHPAGSEADIYATPNWAWRCAAASLLRARFAEFPLRSEWLLSQHRQKRSTTAWFWNGVYGSLNRGSLSAFQKRGFLA